MMYDNNLEMCIGTARNGFQCYIHVPSPPGQYCDSRSGIWSKTKCRIWITKIYQYIVCALRGYYHYYYYYQVNNKNEQKAKRIFALWISLCLIIIHFAQSAGLGDGQSSSSTRNTFIWTFYYTLVNLIFPLVARCII